MLHHKRTRKSNFCWDLVRVREVDGSGCTLGFHVYEMSALVFVYWFRDHEIGLPLVTDLESDQDEI